jgi:hypothetical protein
MRYVVVGHNGVSGGMQPRMDRRGCQARNKAMVLADPLHHELVIFALKASYVKFCKRAPPCDTRFPHRRHEKLAYSPMAFTPAPNRATLALKNVPFLLEPPDAPLFGQKPVQSKMH